MHNNDIRTKSVKIRFDCLEDFLLGITEATRFLLYQIAETEFIINYYTDYPGIKYFKNSLKLLNELLSRITFARENIFDTPDDYTINTFVLTNHMITMFYIQNENDEIRKICEYYGTDIFETVSSGVDYKSINPDKYTHPESKRTVFFDEQDHRSHYYQSNVAINNKLAQAEREQKQGQAQGQNPSSSSTPSTPTNKQQDGMVNLNFDNITINVKGFNDDTKTNSNKAPNLRIVNDDTNANGIDDELDNDFDDKFFGITEDDDDVSKLF